MNQNDKDRFLKAFTFMAEVFAKENSKILLNAYFKAMDKFTIDEVVSAIETAICNVKFFPKPVELIEMITGGSQNIEDRALIEAGKVLKAIKRIGKYKSVQFDDAFTQAVIVQTFGGWVKMCAELNTQEEKWFVKDFSGSYSAYSRQGIKHEGHLSGIAEIDNVSSDKESDLQIEYVGKFEKVKHLSNKNNHEILKLVENIG